MGLSTVADLKVRIELKLSTLILGSIDVVQFSGLLELFDREF
jgi:hypothetical protein